MKRNSKIMALTLMLWSGVACAEIVAENLPVLTPESVGLETPFSDTVWGNPPDPQKLAQSLKAVQEVDFSVPEREVLRQVLLTATGSVDLLVPRLDTLMAQGFYKDALALLDRIPVTQQTSEMRRYRTRILFALGKVSEACREENLSAFDADEIFVRTVCALSLHGAEEAVLAYDVYRESGQDRDAFLNSAGDMLYRQLPAQMPEGKPDLLLLPLVAHAFGDQVFRPGLNRGELMILLNHDVVPEPVRQEVAERLKTPVSQEIPQDGSLLDDLKQIAEYRQRVERHFPPSYWPKEPHAGK